MNWASHCFSLLIVLEIIIFKNMQKLSRKFWLAECSQPDNLFGKLWEKCVAFLFRSGFGAKFSAVRFLFCFLRFFLITWCSKCQNNISLLYICMLMLTPMSVRIKKWVLTKMHSEKTMLHLKTPFTISHFLWDSASGFSITSSSFRRMILLLNINRLPWPCKIFGWFCSWSLDNEWMMWQKSEKDWIKIVEQKWRKTESFLANLENTSSIYKEK